MNSNILLEQINQELDQNLNYLKSLFVQCPDVIFRHYLGRNGNILLIYTCGLINEENLSLRLLDQLLHEADPKFTSNMEIKTSILSFLPVKEIRNMNEVVSFILSGGLVVLFDKVDSAIAFEIKDGIYRGISEPGNEAVIRGPKEGFIEKITANIVLLRQKISSHHLKIAYKDLGRITKTRVAIVYLDHLVNLDLLNEVHKRLDRIDIDGVLESGYLEELIEDHPLSPFPQIQNTERPDTAAGNLLEGRIVLMCDGTPSVLIVPSSFWQMLQSSEDYYNRFYFATFQRILRFFSMLITLLLPAIYIATATFHVEMLPTKLMFTFMDSRERVPFPPFMEALLMEILSEALREAGARLPKVLGQTVSILGAIVIGTAAVDAGIVSAPIVIIVSITGIAGSTIPKNNFANIVRLFRFPLMIMAAILGLFGITLGISFITAHICSLRSFGTSFMAPWSPPSFKEFKDTFIRVPWWLMTRRPGVAKPQDDVRQSQNGWRRRLKNQENK